MILLIILKEYFEKSRCGNTKMLILHTSQAKFLDDDFLAQIDEKYQIWKPLGKRIEQGLYQIKNGLLVNADQDLHSTTIYSIFLVIISDITHTISVFTRANTSYFKVLTGQGCQASEYLYSLLLETLMAEASRIQTCLP